MKYFTLQSVSKPVPLTFTTLLFCEPHTIRSLSRSCPFAGRRGYTCNRVEFRLTPALLTESKDHNIQRKLNTPNFVHILPTIVTCLLQCSIQQNFPTMYRVMTQTPVYWLVP